MSTKSLGHWEECRAKHFSEIKASAEENQKILDREGITVDDPISSIVEARDSDLNPRACWTLLLCQYPIS